MRIIWSISAGRDLHRLTASYRVIDPDLSAEMRRRVDGAANKLSRLGNIGSPLPDGKTYKKSVLKTPFLPFFIVEEEALYVKQNWWEDY